MKRASLPTRATPFEGSYQPVLSGALVREVVLQPGSIRFYDDYRPVLGAGEYTVEIRQTLTPTGAATPLAQPSLDQHFAIEAPRFTLDPSEVQSMFPPPNTSGPFDQNLPHVVLMSRALPWERRLGDGLPAPSNGYPWLALLLFTPDEIILPAGASAIANPTRAGTYTVDQLLKPTDTSVLGPQITLAASDTTLCRAIDITTAVFTRVTPRLADLPYLAHARQVNVDEKTSSLAGTSGWFSVVAGNRFPLDSGAATGGGTTYVAHLVSLEGLAKYLADKPTWPTGVTAVRLASLASWAFTVHAAGLDFRQTMLGLVAGQSSGGDGLRLRLPVPPPDSKNPPTPDSGEGRARRALERGFAALEYETRMGVHTFGWYHGPLVPQPVAPLDPTKRPDTRKPFPSAAAATVYDPVSGTFDLSYAASWEIGRLLALSDRAYATSQQRARKALRSLVNSLRERMRWQDARPLLAAPAAAGAAGTAAGAKALGALAAPGQVSRGFGSWLAASGAQYLAARGATPLAAQQPPALLNAAPRALAAAGVRSLLDRADVRLLLEQRVEAQLDDGPLDSVADWLGGLRVLQGVPFVHLVPDARMLPVESIRFFYVDPNSLDAMCDGARSVGVQTSRDALQQQVVHAPLRRAAIARGSRRRSSLLRRAPADAPAGDPVAGFLLRSAVVSGWPGLEVRAWRDSGGTDPVAPVRIDHVASDVLLALYAEVPARIDIDEPKEGLAFGVQNEWIVALRSVTGSNIGTKVGEATLDATYRRTEGGRDTGVLNVDRWQGALKDKVPGAAAVWGPAAFAIQMVRAPERMRFDHGGASR